MLALSAALGAAAAFDGRDGRPSKLVVDIDGDGRCGPCFLHPTFPPDQLRGPPCALARCRSPTSNIGALPASHLPTHILAHTHTSTQQAQNRVLCPRSSPLQLHHELPRACHGQRGAAGHEGVHPQQPVPGNGDAGGWYGTAWCLAPGAGLQGGRPNGGCSCCRMCGGLRAWQCCVTRCQPCPSRPPVSADCSGRIGFTRPTARTHTWVAG